MTVPILNMYDALMGFPLNRSRPPQQQGKRAFLIRPSSTDHVSELSLEPKFVEGQMIQSYLELIKNEEDREHLRSEITNLLQRYWERLSESYSGDLVNTHDDYQELEAIFLSEEDHDRYALRTGDVLLIAKGQRAGVMCFKHPAYLLDRSEEQRSSYVAHSTFHVLRPKPHDLEERLQYGEALTAWLSSQEGRSRLLHMIQSLREAKKRTESPPADEGEYPLTLPSPWRVSLKEIKSVPLPSEWSDRDVVRRLSLTYRGGQEWHVRTRILRKHHLKIAEENVRRALNKEPKIPYFFSEATALKVTVESLLTGLPRSFDLPHSLSTHPEDLRLWREGMSVLRGQLEDPLSELLNKARELAEEQGFQFIPGKEAIDPVFHILSLMSIEQGHRIPFALGSVAWELSENIRESIGGEHLEESLAEEIPDETALELAHSKRSPRPPLEIVKALLEQARQIIDQLEE